MLGLTTLGIVHTAISLVAVAAGILSFVRHREIAPRTRVGRVYVWATVITCLTGFGIFQHGGFGKPHALGVMTLVLLVVAAVAGRRRVFGRMSRAVELVAYTATFTFHFIPGMVETTTRLPIGAPLIADREGPELQAATGVLFVLFLIGASVQVWHFAKRAGARTSPLRAPAVQSTPIRH